MGAEGLLAGLAPAADRRTKAWPSAHTSVHPWRTQLPSRVPSTGHVIGGFHPKPYLRNRVQKLWHEFKFTKNSPCPGRGEKKKRKRHLLPLCQPSQDLAHHDGYLRTSRGSADSPTFASEAPGTSCRHRRQAGSHEPLQALCGFWPGHPALGGERDARSLFKVENNEEEAGCW